MGLAMNNYEQQAHKLKMLGHPMRLQILKLLRQGESCVCHLEHALGRRQAYVSQQLMALRDAGLVESRKDGLQVYYRLTDAELLNVLDALYGKTDAQLEMLSACPCPHCSNHLDDSLEK